MLYTSLIGHGVVNVHSTKSIITIDWQLEIPRPEQVDILVFLLELFREEPLLEEYHRISMVADQLYSFDIVARLVEEQFSITHVNIGRTGD